MNLISKDMYRIVNRSGFKSFAIDGRNVPLTKDGYIHPCSWYHFEVWGVIGVPESIRYKLGRRSLKVKEKTDE